MRTWVWFLTSLSGSGYHVAVSCGVGRRRVSGLVLLRLGCTPSAVAPIRPLWEAPYAEGVALLKKTKKKKKEMCSRLPTKWTTELWFKTNWCQIILDFLDDKELRTILLYELFLKYVFGLFSTFYSSSQKVNNTALQFVSITLVSNWDYSHELFPSLKDTVNNINGLIISLILSSFED